MPCSLGVGQVVSMAALFLRLPQPAAGKIGEHQVMLNNLMPWVQAVALGHRPVLNVYGEWAAGRGPGASGRRGSWAVLYATARWGHMRRLRDGRMRVVQMQPATPPRLSV